MKRLMARLLQAMGLAITLGIAFGQDVSPVHGLRCEYLKDPSGIDVEKPRLNWILTPGSTGRNQSAYQILVASTPASLEKDNADLWDSGRVSSDQSTWVAYAGKPLTSGARAYWKVRIWDEAGRRSPWSGHATWSMGLLKPSDWYGKWIGEERPAGTPPGTPLPFPWLRKVFTLDRRPARAVAYVNPLGYYELYINGRKVGDEVLSPAVSDYSKRNLYVTHDVADYLVAGRNVVALWLGRGWYVKGHPGVIHDGPLVRAQIDIAMPDGNPIKVGTDGTWKVKESPITPLGRGTAFGDYGGERYDARLDLQNWNSAELDDSIWPAAGLFDPPQVITAAQMVEPNRLMHTLDAVKVESFPQGGYLIDMGRAFAGWLEFRIPGDLPAGTVVKLEYADDYRPSPAGSGGIAPGNAPPGGRRGPGGFTSFNQRDEVVTNGSPIVFCSRFNYHGFRYVRVTGLERPPAIQDATGYLIHTAYDFAGEFTCSNDLMNRIYQMMIWTYRSLSLGGYVVDCPTRERLGYGGDAGTSLETGMFNFGAGGLYNRWLVNWRDSQQAETGSLPHTAPNYQDQGGGSPMWGGFVVTLPWQMYLQYSDKRVLEVNYPMMEKWLGYLKSETVENILVTHKSHAMSMQRWNFLGDWVTPGTGGDGSGNPSDPGPIQLINTLHCLYTLQIAGKIAAILGRNEDSAKYAAWSTAVAQAINQKFYNPEARSYANGKTAYLAFPLLVDIVPPELKDGVMANLEATIRGKNAGHFDSGMHGTYFLLKYLMQADRNDLIYEMVSKKDYPGWGYMLDQGATTSWESWSNGSHIHDTLISIGSWFIQGIGGIRIDENAPGFKHFLIKPALVGDLTYARAKYQSIRGEISSEWRIADGVLQLDVTVPPGTTATVYMPGSGSVQAIFQSAPIEDAGISGGRTILEVGPGQYSLKRRLPL